MGGPSRLDAGESIAPPLDWCGTSRYAVVRRIGRGGMGIVYEAFDRVEQRAVALKPRWTPALSNCAAALRQNGQDDQAISVYQFPGRGK